MYENFSIETQGAYDQQTLFEILVKAASSGDSIENTAKISKNIPTANDIRYHLDKINNFEVLEAQINQALKSRIPIGIKKGRLKMAIDLNLIPYYGRVSARKRVTRCAKGGKRDIPLNQVAMSNGFASPAPIDKRSSQRKGLREERLMHRRCSSNGGCVAKSRARW